VSAEQDVPRLRQVMGVVDSALAASASARRWEQGGARTLAAHHRDGAMRELRRAKRLAKGFPLVLAQIEDIARNIRAREAKP
jgi:hypothetical protein